MLPDPRFRDDIHTECPACASQAPWVGDVIRAYLWRRGGGQLAEVLPHATAGAIDAVLLVEREVTSLEAANLELARERAKTGGRRG